MMHSHSRRTARSLVNSMSRAAGDKTIRVARLSVAETATSPTLDTSPLWKVEDLDTNDEMPQTLAKRSCLRCNETFEPESRFNFICKECTYNQGPTSGIKQAISKSHRRGGLKGDI